MAEQGGGYAPAWRPSPGQTLRGTITQLATLRGAFSTYACLTITTHDGDAVAVHAFHRVLAEELAKLEPKVGERITITYVGKTAGKNRRAYNKYLVESAVSAAIESDQKRRGQSGVIPF